MEYRIERDLLGEKKVPAEAYYGIQTLRAVENFSITGQPPHEELIRALAIVKKAAARANAKDGRLDDDIAKAIIQAAEEIRQGAFMDQFTVDAIQGGAGTSINMNVNEVIANRAIEILGGVKGDYEQVDPITHVNMAQSTNDAVPTAIHIAALHLSDDLCQSLTSLHHALSKKEREMDDVVKMGRTHLQDAVPIRLGQEFGAYARVIKRDLARIRESMNQLYEINMGATAVGTGLNASPEYMKNVTQFLADESSLPLKQAEHLVDATQNTDGYTHLSAALKICAINLSKMANDLRLLSSGPLTGLNEINLPARQPGSSIMPGKVNPVIAEVVNQISFQVIGNDHTVSLASEAGQLELNVMGPVLVHNLLQSLTILRNGIRTFTDYAIEGITANVERCRTMVERSVGIITAISPHIGYGTASQIAKEALSTGKSIREICLEQGHLTAEELDQILDTKGMTEPGISGENLLHTDGK